MNMTTPIAKPENEEPPMPLTRRQLLTALPSLAFASTQFADTAAANDRWYVGSIPDQPYDIRIVNIAKVPANFRRQDVRYDGPEGTGTIIVDAQKRFLYHVTAPGRAVRYGIASGRDGAAWHGEAVVGRKAKWPGWTPTANMRMRNPKLPVHQDGGPSNPLGARALYLYKDGRDTLYRIHGTNDPSSIGRAASSGCIRMLNEDVFELFGSVPIGTRVVVR